MAERMAVLRNVRESGRCGSIPGKGYLEPGEEYTTTEALALKLADPTVGLVIIRIEPAVETEKFKAAPPVHRKRVEK